MDCVTLSSKGQIVLIKDIREKLGLKAGDKFIEKVENDQIVLKPVKPLAELFGSLRNEGDFKGKTTEEIMTEIKTGWG
ncbi:MAG: AbrB/MazE/SpoVT family DNA-binding domain-containing protein [Candidatus Altiarchaeota archaeon]